MPIYKVSHNNTHRLVRAQSQAAARSHVAKNSIAVEVASPDDIYELARSGSEIEDLITTQAQKEIGE